VEARGIAVSRSFSSWAPRRSVEGGIAFSHSISIVAPTDTGGGGGRWELCSPVAPSRGSTDAGSVECLAWRVNSLPSIVAPPTQGSVEGAVSRLSSQALLTLVG
jgi:hypothetical protein